MDTKDDQASRSESTSPGRANLSESSPRPRASRSAGQKPATSGASQTRDNRSRDLAKRVGYTFLVFLLFMLVDNLVFWVLFPGPPDRIEIPYTYFRQQVEANNVSEVTSRGDLLQGTFRQPITYPPGDPRAVTSDKFTVYLPQFADPNLEKLLTEHNVVINARPIEEPRSWWLNLLLTFGPPLLLIGAFVWLSRNMTNRMGGMFGFGKSIAKRVDQAEEGGKRVTFEDVAGIEEAKRELAEVVDFLKDPQKYTRLGGTVPKGILLVGPPGTGKTLLAKAVAGEAGVPFFSTGASEFVEMIVGVGASRVRDLFRQAREAAPAIIFIDELDAIGRARGATIMSGSNSEQEQTLNQILSEMDGFSSREGVIVLAATNRPDVLDPALLRAGRFDRRVPVLPPDRNGREAILRVHTRNVPLAPDVDLMQIAAATPGLVGADLRNLVNEAALTAARRNADMVHQQDFMDALEKIILGPARHLLMSHQERERVAYHEGGHTILGLVMPGADPVNRVTITPRGQALGVTYQRPQDDRHNYDESYLRARIVGILGGRAAEELVYGTRTTGAENDLEQATNLARQMVTRWGMSEALGPVALAGRENPYLAGDTYGLGASRPFSESTAQLVDAEVRRILDECYDHALHLLRQHQDALQRLVQALLEKDTLDEQEILRVTGLTRAPGPETLPIHSVREQPSAPVAAAAGDGQPVASVDNGPEG